MATAQGRDLTSPVVSVGFTGEGLVFRVDDNDHPAFWLALAYGRDELEKLLDQWQVWHALHYGPRIWKEPPEDLPRGQFP